LTLATQSDCRDSPYVFQSEQSSTSFASRQNLHQDATLVKYCQNSLLPEQECHSFERHASIFWNYTALAIVISLILAV